MHEPSDPQNDAQPASGPNPGPQPEPAAPDAANPTQRTEPAVRNGAVFTDSRVEIEIDDETGRPQLRIVAGARPKT